MMRTSQTDPLVIDQLAYPEGPGRIGLAMCPGKCSPGPRAGTVATQLLIEMGIDAREAIRRIRVARPYSIESGSQQGYLHRLAEQDGIERISRS